MVSHDNFLLTSFLFHLPPHLPWLCKITICPIATCVCLKPFGTFYALSGYITWLGYGLETVRWLDESLYHIIWHSAVLMYFIKPHHFIPLQAGVYISIVPFCYTDLKGFDKVFVI